MNASPYLERLTEVTVLATVLMLFMLGLRPLLRKQSAAVRHCVWMTTIIGLLALPIAGTLLSKSTVNLPGHWTLPFQQSTAPQPITPNLAAIETPVPSASATTLIANPAPALPLDTPLAPHAPEPPAPSQSQSHLATYSILGIWAIGAVSVLLYTLAGWFRLGQLIRLRFPEANESIVALCHQAASQMPGNRPFEVKVSPGPHMPFVFGIHRATLVLPAEFLEWDPERRQAVLFHEIGHIQRHDCLTQLLGQLFCAIYWFHPLSWWINRLRHHEAEMACDNLAIQCGSEPQDYANHLLQIAKSFRRIAIGATAGNPMATSPSRLENRLEKILAPGINRRHLTRSFLAGCVTVGTLAVLGSASLSLGANSPSDAPTIPDTPSPATEFALPEDRPDKTPKDARTPDPEPLLIAQAPKTQPAKTVASPPEEDRLKLGGALTARSSTVINYQSEFPMTLAWLASGGTRVKKGDRIAEFVEAGLEDQIQTLRIELATEQAALNAAENQVNEAKLDLQAAVTAKALNERLAELEIKKAEADYTLRLKKAKSKVALATKQEKESATTLSRTKSRVDSGLAPTEQLNIAELGLAEAEANLEIATEEFANLVEITREYEQVAQSLSLQTTRAAKDRAVSRARTQLATAEANLEAKRAVLEIKSNQLSKLNSKLTAVYAPSDGVIMRPDRDDRARGLTAPKVGTMVRPRQALVLLVDASILYADFYYDEDLPERYETGDPVEIHIDILPGDPFPGIIESIAVPANGNLLNQRRLRVRVENPKTRLLPGLKVAAYLEK